MKLSLVRRKAYMFIYPMVRMRHPDAIFFVKGNEAGGFFKAGEDLCFYMLPAREAENGKPFVMSCNHLITLQL